MFQDDIDHREARQNYRLAFQLITTPPSNSLNSRVDILQSQIQFADLFGPLSHHGDPNNPHYCPDDPSYWYVQEIEPNARGVHEIRRKIRESLERWQH